MLPEPRDVPELRGVPHHHPLPELSRRQQQDLWPPGPGLSRHRQQQDLGLHRLRELSRRRQQQDLWLRQLRALSRRRQQGPLIRPPLGYALPERLPWVRRP